MNVSSAFRLVIRVTTCLTTKGMPKYGGSYSATFRARPDSHLSSSTMNWTAASL